MKRSVTIAGLTLAILATVLPVSVANADVGQAVQDVKNSPSLVPFCEAVIDYYGELGVAYCALAIANTPGRIVDDLTN